MLPQVSEGAPTPHAHRDQYLPGTPSASLQDFPELPDTYSGENVIAYRALFPYDTPDGVLYFHALETVIATSPTHYRRRPGIRRVTEDGKHYKKIFMRLAFNKEGSSAYGN